MNKTVTLALALILLPGAALAHAHVERSDPAANAVLRSAPKQVKLTFSEPVTLAFTGAEIDDSKGKPVAAEAAKLSAGSKTAVEIPLKGPLAPGTYTVKWHAVADDSHRSSGAFGFSVKP